MIVKRWPTIAIWTAVIWLSVSVPVLSELIADVEPSVSTDLQPLHDGAGLGQRRRPVGEDRRHDGGEAGRDGRDRERDGGQEQHLERLVAVQAEPDRDRERDAGDDQDLVGQRVELLGQRRLLRRRLRQQVARCGRPRSPCRSR